MRLGRPGGTGAGRAPAAVAIALALLLASSGTAAASGFHGETSDAERRPARPTLAPAGADAVRLKARTPPQQGYLPAVPPGPPASVPEGTLRAGVGRADLTPPKVGYFLGGWTRADRLGRGVSTRLTTSALMLERGGQRLALVAMADFAVPQGLQQAVAAKVADLGLTERSIVLSATHTHSGTGGYANTETLNTAAPGVELILSNPASLAGLVSPSKADPQLYRFIVEQVAAAIRRAHATMGPATAAWGRTQLSGLTRNRSLRARLADFGTDDPSKVPYEKTINPAVDVLRVDRLVGPTCTTTVRRATRRATSTKRRARTAARTLTRARSAARRATGTRVAPARRALRTAERRARAATRAAKRARTTARRTAARPCAKDGTLPMGGWANFSNHGTVVKAEFGLYSADHGGVAANQFEERVRAASDVPASQPVIAVYGNSDEGDQSAGLDHGGPSGADLVGRTEGDAFFRAWKDAGPRLSTTPKLDVRFTRFCFCGRSTSDGGTVDTQGRIGAPFLTGSEEGRGPVFDATGLQLEGLTIPSLSGVQGNKVVVPIGKWSDYVPMVLAQVGDGAVVTMPGEATIGVGERARAAVLAKARKAGVERVMIAGLANDFLNYITTPEEYDTQQYEGASTVFGRHEGTFLADRAGDLAAALAGDGPPLEAHPYDASNGVRADGPAYPAGSPGGRILTQPKAVRRLGLAQTTWQGAPGGADKPIDTKFLTIERREGDDWVAVDTDLGHAIAWRVDDAGRYTAIWNPAETTPVGTYRFVVTAARYRLTSGSFAVKVSDTLEVRPQKTGAGRAAVQVGFPLPRENVDLIHRPTILTSGTVDFLVGGRTVSAPIDRKGVAAVDVPAGAAVRVPAGGARDGEGNISSKAVTLGGAAR